MSAVSEMPVVESVLPTLSGPALDERICQFLVAKGRLKEADLVRGRRLHEEDPSGIAAAQRAAFGSIPQAPSRGAHW